ncbi:hypothetical protein B0T26DRAFT_713602 [Lasiosphaeria miniovina]|uniref:Uncharacterized protein n=1 Tax=Lasiosphaeria miniovina TaxID=1954250 RepID=A0AA40E0V6_9PEZI|nr:uncharacterized protein B0T26DRAFT_713602 [Lasiosphaeria miniovina]KAK0718563.1 hypothetical protein B0T26DRAFT_713602 [Lasiosphaeria miniovina]
MRAVSCLGQLVSSPRGGLFVCGRPLTGVESNRPVFWGYLMQIFGYAAVMPVYAALHLFGSPVALASLGRPRARATALRHPSRFRLRVLVPAFALGYFLPSLLMGWPVSSPALHQWLNGLWQGFPLYVVASQQLFARLVAPAQQGHGAILSRAYSWAFYTAAAVQLCTYAVILAAKATPGLFPSWAAEAFAFGAVFAPGPFHSSKPLSSMVAAMHDFYKWDQYVGSAAAITWAVCLDVSSQEAGVSLADWAILGWDVVRWSAIAGPAGALVRLLQRRDGRVLLEDTVVEDKRS